MSGSTSSSGAHSANSSKRSRCSPKRGPFRAIYRSPSRSEAEQRLTRFLAAVDRAAIPSFSAFAKGIRLWREELLAYSDQPITNGYTEGAINKIKVIKRRAYGLPTFNGFRQRVLVACG
jgi:transposase